MSLIAPDNPWGITLQVDFLSRYTIAASTITALQKLGVSWVRMIESWSNIEGPENTFNWTAMDANIQAINAAGLNAYFVITNEPLYRRNTNAGAGIYLLDPASAGVIVSHLALRYQSGSPFGTLSCIEVGNEDFSLSTSSNYNGGYLADVMNTAYPLVKSIDPTMLCVHGGMLQNNKVFVANWFAQFYNGGGVSASGGVGTHTDALNTHYYRSAGEDPLDPSYLSTNTISAQLDALYAASVAAGYPHREVWLSEFGFAANSGGTGGNLTYAVQDQFGGEVFDTARSKPYCTHAFYYTYNTADNNSLAGGAVAGKHPLWQRMNSMVFMYSQWLRQDINGNKRLTAATRTAAQPRTAAATRTAAQPRTQL